MESIDPSVIVIGAGPAGLAAALELATKGRVVTVLEKDWNFVGGLARTVVHRGLRYDLGPHRFFSKNPEINLWWRERLPDDFIQVQRRTRIRYRNRFFDYPLRAWDALLGLGVGVSVACLLSYFRRRVLPVHPERSFEDWVCNRFGDRLYRIFFKAYTEKVWGVPCKDISADWASQRIKGLSLMEAVMNSLPLRMRRKQIKTLIEEFDYPRLGPGQMWEKTRDDVIALGGKVMMGRAVQTIHREGQRVVGVSTMSQDGQKEYWPADAVIASMPLGECVLSLDPPLGPVARDAASRLGYRDLIVVVLVVNRRDLFPDNWIYVHDPELRVGRIQNINNWSAAMVSNPDVTCLELEYFCNQGDDLWLKTDAELVQLGRQELALLGFARAEEVTDAHVVRVEKAYPVYDSAYQAKVCTIREALAGITNLQVVGRNGMHKYNNQDHSMMTGILAARNVAGGHFDLWRVNTDAEYLESDG